MTATLLLLAALLLVVFGGLMAALDAALGVTSRVDLQEMAAADRNASALRGIAADPDAHANAVVFIRVLAETTAAVLVTVAFTIIFDDNIWWAMLAAAVIMTGVSFVAVGASPRSVGRQHARGLLRRAAFVVRGARLVLGPLAHGLVALGNRVTPGVARTSFASEEQLLSIIDEAASQDLIEADDRDLIHSVFDFTDTYVRAVMVPRTDLVTVESTASTRDAMETFLDRGVSRIPVMDAEADDAVGMLYLKDLVQFGFSDEVNWRDAPISRVARPAVFVPESMKAETLLQQMKREAVHVCLVVDEYGGISGLVTLEDLIEELVGDIADEYDPRSDEVTEIEPGRYRVSARLGLDEVGDLFSLDIEDEDVDSIGGLLGKALGRVPQAGSTARHAGLVMTGGASRGRNRGIATVFVERSESPGDTDETLARAPRHEEVRAP